MKERSYKRIQNLIHVIVETERTYQKNVNLLCEDLLSLSLKEDYPYGIVFAWTHLALYSVFNNEQNETNFYLKKTIEFNEKYHFIELQIECKNIQGLYYKSINNTYEAFSCYLEGIELAKDTNQSISVAMFYNNLALILFEFDDYNSAKIYLLESLHYTDKATSEKKALYQKSIYSNLVSVSYFLKNKQEAKKYLDCFNQVKFNTSKIEMNTLCNHIIVNTLEDKRSEVIKLTHQFVDKLKNYDDSQVFNECCLISKALIQISHQELASVLLQHLSKNSENEGRDRLQYLKLKIEYNEIFQVNDKQIYIDFYDTVEAIEATERQLLIEGVKSNIHMTALENDKRSLSKVRSRLENEVQIDELTGLYNRHFFNKLLSRGNEIKSATSFTCIMIDLDYFKQYNDEYGHAKGDHVLRTVGDCLNEHAIPNLYPCRYGGDEFACLCYAISQTEIDSYVKHVQTSLENRRIVHEKSKIGAYVTMTFGSYHADTDLQKDSSFYIEMADKALYQAKEQGRNGYVKLGDNTTVYE